MNMGNLLFKIEYKGLVREYEGKNIIRTFKTRA